MIEVKDGKEQVKIGCFTSTWKMLLVGILIFNSGKILDFIFSFIRGCR